MGSATRNRTQNEYRAAGGWSAPLPFLVAVLSVTVLAAENAESGIRLADLPLLVVFSLLVAMTFWIGVGLATRVPPFRGILAGALTGAVLVGGRVVEVVALAGVAYPVAFLLLLAAVVVVGVHCIYWQPRVPAGVVRFLTLASVFLLLMNLFQMRAMAWAPRSDTLSPSADAASGAGGTALPDIYLIVLDAYSGPSSIRDVYGLDVEPFLDALEELGFDVPRAARANYTATVLAMGAMLGLDYLDSLLGPVPPSREDRSAVYALLHDNATIRLLRERGYRIVFHRSAFPPLRSSPAADVHLPAFQVGEFQVAWVTQTILFAAVRAGCELLTCAEREPFEAESPDDLKRKFDALAAGAGEAEGPAFHYAHFLLPHEPLIFNADCSPREVTYWGAERSPQDPEVVKQGYADQVVCTNRLVLDTVRRILARQADDAVIILQSDHGYAGLLRTPALEAATEAQIRERMDVFAAYYVPGSGRYLGYAGVTPVNALRSILSEVFDVVLQPLPDRSYWSSSERPFDFTEVH